MSLSFEEMADASIPDAEEPVSGSGRSKLVLFLGVACVAAAGALSYYYFSRPAPLPEAAEILLSVEEDIPGVLPHELDSATEFEESFDYLKEGTDAPDFRAPEQVADVVVSEEATSVGAPAVVAEVVEPVTEVVEVAAVPVEVAAVPVETVEAPAEVVIDRAQEIVIKQTLAADTEVEFERDWGGVVLVPDTAKLAKAYTSDVRLSRVEAHPIDGERVRVWARIQNITEEPMAAAVGCEFRSSQYSYSGSANFDPMQIPAGGFVDVQFVSAHDQVESYTVMVKRGS